MESDATKLNVVSSNNVESHMVAVHTTQCKCLQRVVHPASHENMVNHLT